MSKAKREKITGTGIPLRGNEIDTDRIIPARFMKCVTFDGLGEFAFYDARFTEEGEEKDHTFNKPEYRNGSILVVNENFGCGSSREHAPQALLRFGVKAIVGESFAEIFAGNCASLGVPAATAQKADIEKIMKSIEENPALPLELDVRNRVLKVGDRVYDISLPESSRVSLVAGTWDTTSTLLKNEAAIKRTASHLPYLKGFAL